MNPIAVKFGGSSLADAGQIKKAAAIIKANPDRRYVTISAPGKRDSGDTKITDRLYECHALAAQGQDFSEVLDRIGERFAGIISGLGINFDLKSELEILRAHLLKEPQKDYIASRGEYLNAKIVAAYLGFAFTDAAEMIFFDENGKLDEARTFRVMGERLAALPCAVIPGFYGVMPDGEIHTFSRGGSDVTGSIVARSVNARLYENWTDVSGMLSADPRIVKNPKGISALTYRELRELSYMGASVLHEDAVFPVRAAGIPVNIRNTNQPDDSGTFITAEPDAQGAKKRTVTGIAGRKGFTGVAVAKSMMNTEVGFGARLLQIFAGNGVPFEHCPSGIDSLAVIVNTELFAAAKEKIMSEIQSELAPESVSVHDGLAMIAVVGQGMVRSRGTAVKVFKALADAKINIRMIDQGPSELNIIVGVDEGDFDDATRAIYHELEALM